MGISQLLSYAAPGGGTIAGTEIEDAWMVASFGWKFPRGLTISLACQLLLFLPGAARAQWADNGVRATCCLGGPMLCRDASSGSFIIWTHLSTSSGDDIFAQHLNAQGYVQWPLAGVPVTVALGDQFTPNEVISDDAGGTLVLWEDFRNAPLSGYDVYALRMTPQGSAAAGWIINGTLLCDAANNQRFPVGANDDAGGFYFAWQDERAQANVPQIFVQHLAADGSVASGWPVNGRNAAPALGPQYRPQVAADGTGGFVLGWADSRNSGTSQTDIYALRLDAAGNAVGAWPIGGVAVSTAAGYENNCSAVPDGVGGFYIGWINYGVNPYVYDSGDIWCQHLQGDGSVTPGWPAGGLPVCVLPGPQRDLEVAGDGFGNLLLVWDDYRNSYSQVYAQRLLADGGLAPGWPANGHLLSTAVAYQLGPKLVSDGLGGAYVAFDIETGTDHTYVQHVMAAGAIAPGWPAEGRPVVMPVQGTQRNPGIVSDGVGGAIVAWEDSRGGIWAQHYGPDGPVAVEVSLVGATAFPDRVELSWWSDHAANLRATIFRRMVASAWRALGSCEVGGDNQLVYVDRDVIPGARYSYRLEYDENERRVVTAESWVDVPTGRLALEGARPNPTLGPLEVRFSLTDRAPASLELLDIHGRRIEGHEVGALGPGRHILRLGDQAALRSGVYWLRLTSGTTSLRKRVAVVR